MNTILQKIISDKQKWIAIQNKKFLIKNLQHSVTKSSRNFYKVLSQPNNKTKFILECKKASPSKGVIRKKFNISKIANVYKNYASVISVLTDEKYFCGSFDFLKKISEIAKQPILCKDFIISSWQIYFARLHQADAILLMLSILNDDTYIKFRNIAHNLNMGVLTEIVNDKEWNRAIKLKAKIIGINNRNLHDLSVDLNRTYNLAVKNKNGATIISESGIKHHYQVRKLSKYVNGLLIGSAIMAEPNIKIAIKRIVLGENKICGLTRICDAHISYKYGALYGGLIFIKNSPRFINISNAQNIVFNTHGLLFIGVFKNTDISKIIKLVNNLKLSAVQLHGNEDNNYIKSLRQSLPKNCNIWKAINVQQKLPILNMINVDRYLLDNGGGSGEVFDWTLLKHQPLDKIILAGGLNAKNCAIAADLGCAGLDFNSGVEYKPGIKNYKKISKIFKIIRNY